MNMTWIDGLIALGYAAVGAWFAVAFLSVEVSGHPREALPFLPDPLRQKRVETDEAEIEPTLGYLDEAAHFEKTGQLFDASQLVDVGSIVTDETRGLLSALGDLVGTAREEAERADRLGLFPVAAVLDAVARQLDAARTRLVQDPAGERATATAFLDAARMIVAGHATRLDRYIQ